MPVSTYLQELINQKKALANNLVTKGVQASEDEKFNTLVPKVLEVSGGNNGVDTSDATAIADDLLLGKTAYVNEQKITGTIETYNGEIENGIEIPDMPDGTLEITENGEYDVNLIAQVEVNVPTCEEYEGEYTIIPSSEEQAMLTQNKTMKQNVTIKAIPYYETSNVSGKTVIIGGN